MIVGGGVGSDGGAFRERFAGMVIVFLCALNWSRSSAAC